MNWNLKIYWPRLHVSYLQALGVLRVLAEQFDPSVRCSYAMRSQGSFCPDEEWAFRFSCDNEAVEDFWKNHYTPSPIYSPWNGATWDSGFQKSLTAARGVERLGNYVAVVDAAGKIFNGKPDPKRKEEVLRDLISGVACVSPEHTRWTRACWRLKVTEPPPDKNRKGKKPKTKVEVKARAMLGSGGCESRLDYGGLFLRNAVWWITGKRISPSPNALGGFAFPDTSPIDWGFDPPDGGWNQGRWTPLQILLLMEGAMSFLCPWPEAKGTEAEPWGENVYDNGRRRYHFPLWEGEKNWGEVQKILCDGWQGEGVTKEDVRSLIHCKWNEHGEMMRMTSGMTTVTPRYKTRVELRLVHSLEECGWYAIVKEGGGQVYETDLGERDEIHARAISYINETWEGLAAVTEDEVTVE